ncbi:MAG: helicase, partial [Planctomycetia bacterium]|nr:helicase [Planctomycetia bacterium]
SYRAKFAYPTEKLRTITSLRSVNPIYGTFLLEQLGLADRAEILQAFESVLEMPSTVANDLRPPKYRDLPPGALANARLDQTLLKYGLAVHEELVPRTEEEEQKYREERRFAPFLYEQERFYLIPFAEKLRRLFDFQYPGVPLRITPVWAAGELLLDYAGDFNKYIASKGLQKQEGVVFRHLLRLVLLLQEFAPLKPVDSPLAPWRAELEDLVTQLVASCRKIDPSSVEETLNSAKRPDLLVQN